MEQIVAQFFLSIRTPARTAFFTFMTMLGNVQTVVAIFILVSIFLIYKKQKKTLLALIVTLGIAESITYIAKMIFHRARPLHGLIVETDYSFPSGHATVAVALYGFLLLYLAKQPGMATLMKAIIWTIGIAVILLIGMSRLYLGVHYLADVIAGYAVGLIGLWAGSRISHGNN